MISITEKTADKLCNEFRELVQTIDKTLEDEAERFQKVTDSFNKLNKESATYKLAEAMYNTTYGDHMDARKHLEDEKNKYLGFIEVLMLGETE